MLMNFVSRWRRSAWTLPLAAVAALVIVAINEAAYQRSSGALASLGERSAARTQIQTLWRRLVEAETGQRGYLLTGRKEYLGPYQESVADTDAALKWLAAYYGQDAETQSVVADLAKHSTERLSLLATTLKLYDEGRHEAWREIVLTDIGREKMDGLRVLSEKLLAIESQRVTSERTDIVDTLRMGRIGVSAITALSVLSLFLFLRQTAAFDALQRQLGVALAAERDQLEADVASRTAELTKLARHLQTAREDERSRLARELHDELGALLTAVKLDAARLKRGISPMVPEVETRLRHLNDTINNGIELKRRIIEDLHPSSLSNLGLVSALEIQVREFAQRSEVKVTTDLTLVALTDSAQITVYRLVQESLTNIAKYAAASEATVSLQSDGQQVRVAVRDNGRGFDAKKTRGDAHGLLGMRYRVEAEGGVMKVSSQPGQGTLIEAWLPARAEGSAEAGAPAVAAKV